MKTSIDHLSLNHKTEKHVTDDDCFNSIFEYISIHFIIRSSSLLTGHGLTDSSFYLIESCLYLNGPYFQLIGRPTEEL